MELLLCTGLMVLAFAMGRGVIAQDWRTANTAPVGLAPDPLSTPEAIVQVYAARTWGWKGSFGVHTWIAVKAPEAKNTFLACKASAPEPAPVVNPGRGGKGIHSREGPVEQRVFAN